MLDQIKDSERMVVDVAQASEYYYYDGTLQQNQTFSAPIVNAQGKARLAYLFANVPGSVGSITFRVDVSPNLNMSPYWDRVNVSPAAGAGTSGDIVLPAQFFQIKIFASSTSGSYSYRAFVALHPVS